MVDVKPYIRHHPLLGYEYAPGYDATLPQPGGGFYRLRTNLAGLRSDREVSFKKTAGKSRLLVLGDSFAAGQYVSNEARFTEILERRLPAWEAVNLGLEGTGTDQQLLIYQETGQKFEHDAVLLLPFLQNIRRNLAEARESFDPKTKERMLLPKPRFELAGDSLELRGVPVPTERLPAAARTDAAANGSWKSKLSTMPGMRALKQLAYSLRPWEPFPEYGSPDQPAWRLMQALLKRIAELARPRPLLIAPVFYVSYVRFKMATSYLQRFAEFAATEPNVRVVDLLPAFRALGQEAERAFFEPFDCHWSPFGHVVVAQALTPILAELEAA